MHINVMSDGGKMKPIAIFFLIAFVIIFIELAFLAWSVISAGKEEWENEKLKKGIDG